MYDDHKRPVAADISGHVVSEGLDSTTLVELLSSQSKKVTESTGIQTHFKRLLLVNFSSGEGNVERISVYTVVIYYGRIWTFIGVVACRGKIESEQGL
jgi:asparagine synthetase B (glutamine-hydrolysing)